MHSEKKEAEAGPANPRHSRDHSRDSSYTTDFDTIYASTRTLKKTYHFPLQKAKPNSLSYYWPFFESLLWLPSALIAFTLIYPRSGCCCRLLLVLLLTITINQWLCAVRNTGHGLSLIEFKLRLFCWQIDGTNVSNVPLRFALDRIRAADRRVRLHIKKADHTEVCSSKYTSWHFTSVNDKNFRTCNLSSVFKTAHRGREGGDPEMFGFLLRDVKCRCYWSLLGFSGQRKNR